MNLPSDADSGAGYLRRVIKVVTGGIEPRLWLLKFVPLVLMQTLAVFTYTALKNAKNSIFARSSETTIFTFLKIMVIVPLALMFPVLLKKITEMLKNRKEKIPYILISIFVAFYLVFALVIVPMRGTLHYPQLSKILMNIPFLPPALAQGFGDVFGNWGYSLFYGTSELWAAVGINVISWGIANEICSKNESLVFYPMFGMISNFGAFWAAKMMLRSQLSGASEDQFSITIRSILMIVVGSLIAMGGIYLFIEKFILKNPKYVTKKESKVKSKPNPHDGLAMVLRSPYLRKIAMMVLAYSLSIVLLEQCWYDSIVKGFGRAAYTPVTAKTTEINAIMTILMSVLSTLVMSKFPWIVRAMLPVIMMGGSGILFLIMFVFGVSSPFSAAAATIGMASLAPFQLVVILGSLQNISGRSSKYSLFDSTKEQLFNSSHDEDIRSKGKAAVDVTVGRISKSGASFITVVLLTLHPFVSTLFGGHSAEAPVAAAVVNTKDVNTEDPKSIAQSDRPDRAKSVLRSVAKQMLQVNVTDNKTEIVFDPSKVDLAGLGVEKKVSDDGKVTFVLSDDNSTKSNSKATEVVKQSQSSVAKPSTQTRKSTIKDIAPAMLVIVTIIVAMWAYAVISIAPEYEANIREHDDEDSKPKSSSEGLTIKNLLYLVALSASICGGLYYWVSKEMTQILSSIKK